MRGLVELLVFIGAICTAAGQLEAPANLQAFAEEDGALIRFDPVEGAVAYLGVLGTSESSSVESPDPQLYFGELDPLTEYTVFVSAIDEEGNDGEPAFLVFSTGVGTVTNFKIVTRSSSLITLEWDPMPGVDSYIIDAVEDTSQPPLNLVNISDTADVPSRPRVVMTGDASARIIDLKEMTFYKISIRGMKGTNMGPVSTIRARTDGEGLVIYNIWTAHTGAILGGTGAVFKPLEHTSGPYRMRLVFPCDLKDFEVWEAILDNTNDTEPGVYNLLQDLIWMQEKNEVGFNFYTQYNESRDDNCDLDLKQVEVEYNSGPARLESTEEFDIAFDVYDWGGVGILNLKMEELFRQPNQAADESDRRQPKPDRALMAFSVTTGPNCTSLVVKDCWNVDRVYNSSVDNGDATYFLQPDDMYFTNDIGIIITFDEATCPDREGITVSLLSGGNLVAELQEAYLLQEVRGTCSDDPFAEVLL